MGHKGRAAGLGLQGGAIRSVGRLLGGSLRARGAPTPPHPAPPGPAAEVRHVPVSQHAPLKGLTRKARAVPLGVAVFKCGRGMGVVARERRGAAGRDPPGGVALALRCPPPLKLTPRLLVKRPPRATKETV